MRYAYQSSYDHDYNCTTILTSPHHPFIYQHFHQQSPFISTSSYQHPRQCSVKLYKDIITQQQPVFFFSVFFSTGSFFSTMFAFGAVSASFITSYFYFSPGVGLLSLLFVFPYLISVSSYFRLSSSFITQSCFLFNSKLATDLFSVTYISLLKRVYKFYPVFAETSKYGRPSS